MPRISLDIVALTAERAALEQFLAQPDAYSAPDFTAKNKRFAELETIIATATKRATVEQQLAEARQLAQGNDELAELAKLEIPEDEATIAQLDDELFILLTPKDPNDEKTSSWRSGLARAATKPRSLRPSSTACICAGVRRMVTALSC